MTINPIILEVDHKTPTRVQHGSVGFYAGAIWLSLPRTEKEADQGKSGMWMFTKEPKWCHRMVLISHNF